MRFLALQMTLGHPWSTESKMCFQMETKTACKVKVYGAWLIAKQVGQMRTQLPLMIGVQSLEAAGVGNAGPQGKWHLVPGGLMLMASGCLADVWVESGINMVVVEPKKVCSRIIWVIPISHQQNKCCSE